MKTVILAGGRGTRLEEETVITPKPLVTIGGMPMLWHIMKGYSRYGFNDFIICLGYKGYMIKEYFANYRLHRSNLTIDLSKAEGGVQVHEVRSEPWKVTLVDTGAETQTGGRIRRARPYVGDEPFMLTYGDGVSDVDIGALVAYHRSHRQPATLTGVHPPSRFGLLDIDAEERVRRFREKPGAEVWINAGFFVLEPETFDYLGDDGMPWERDPLETLAAEGKLKVYKHDGFWQCMDTIHDKRKLEGLWAAGNPPWLPDRGAWE